MLEMKSRSALIALFAGTTLAVVACGDDNNNDNGAMPTATVSPTGVPTTSGTVSPTVAPGTGTVAPTVGPTGTVAPVTPGTGGTGGTGGTVTPGPVCDPAPATPVDVPVVSYGFDDKTTTYEVTSPTPGTLCLAGIAGSSDNGMEGGEYANWGAGIGLQMGADDDTGFDAAAHGIAGVQFVLSEVTARPVRVQMTLANAADIAEPTQNYSANAYGWGGSNPEETETDGPVVVPFAELELPEWTQLPETHQLDLDPTKLNALQLQVANVPKDVEEPYKFCVTNVEWINACGEVVAVSVLPEPGEAMPGGDAGDSTTDPMAGDGGVTDTTAPDEGDAGGGDTTMPMGEEDAGTDPVEGALNFATDIHPILLDKCGSCHGEGTEGPAPKFVLTDAAAAEAEVTTRATAIKTRVQSTMMNMMMPPSTAPDLTTEEEATLVEWIDSL